MLLSSPTSPVVLPEGAIVRLSRFDAEEWQLKFGWYSWGGNRPVCGWYLVSLSVSVRIRPFQLPDLDDIYLVETRPDVNA